MCDTSEEASAETSELCCAQFSRLDSFSIELLVANKAQALLRTQLRESTNDGEIGSRTRTSILPLNFGTPVCSQLSLCFAVALAQAQALTVLVACELE